MKKAMKKTMFAGVAIAAVLAPVLALAQSGKMKPATATYIMKEDIDRISATEQPKAVRDENAKVIDLGYENFSVRTGRPGRTERAFLRRNGLSSEEGHGEGRPRGGRASERGARMGRHSRPRGLSQLPAVAKCDAGRMGESEDREVTRPNAGEAGDEEHRSAPHHIHADYFTVTFTFASV
jgi:hypothetical protein